MATRDDLAAFHDRDYIDALARAEAEGDLPPALRERTRIGADSNVIHPLVFRRPATGAGTARRAAELTLNGGAVHAPGVGSHHAQRDHAAGFCFVNDVVLTLLAWRSLGLRRIAYLDLDAHHGDGVEAAFADVPEVLTISVHEAGRWPRTGTESLPGRGILNFPVPPGFHDRELEFLLQAAILPAIRRHRPEALFLLPGADALAGDPLAKLSLSNGAIWAALRALRPLAPRLIVGGGGGYNPFLLGRCWAGLWAALNDLPVPAILPEAAQAVLSEVRYFRAAGRNPPPAWSETLADPPNIQTVRDAVKALALQENDAA